MTGVFKAKVETAPLYGSMAWTLAQSPDKNLDRAYAKMLRVVKNVTWRQCITNEVLYAGLSSISTTIKERCLRFSGQCWRSKNEVVSDLSFVGTEAWQKEHRMTGSHIC